MARIRCSGCGRACSTHLIACPDCGTLVGYTGGTSVGHFEGALLLPAKGIIALFIGLSILLLAGACSGGENKISVGQTTIDKSGNLYLVGYAIESLVGLVVKYDSDGQELWGIQLADRSQDVVTDGAGNLYVLSHVPPTPAEPRVGFVVKYDIDGQELWRRPLAPLHREWFVHVTIDAAGRVYVGGSGYVVKYDSDGNELWARQLNLDSALVGKFEDTQMTIDNAGNLALVRERQHCVSVAGYFGGSDLFCGISAHVMWRYDGDGNELLGAKILSGGVATTDSAGNVYVVGPGNVHVGGGINLAKHDTDGNEQWRRQLGSHATYITTDSAGNVYLAEGLVPENYRVQGRDVVKFDSDGNELWGIELSGVADQVTTDSASNVYVVDRIRDQNFSIVKSDVVKYDTDGNELWRHQIRFPQE